MAINFPDSPIDGQTYSSGDFTWTYQSSPGAWICTGGGATGGGGIGAVVEDPAPVLGGPLDLDGNTVGDATEADLTKLHALTATSTELNHVDGVTSAIQTQIDGKAATSHTHAQSDITGLTTALSGKAASVHTHPQSDITNLTTDLAGKAAAVHTHAQSDITGLSTALAGKASSVHTHPQSDITNLTTDLAGKAATSHTHAQSDITNLTTDLAGKAASSHTHAQSDITNLTTDLAGKAAASHTHAQSDITNLAADLALKAPLASPTFTGDPKAPTASPGDNDTSIATTAFVAAAVTAAVAGISFPVGMVADYAGSSAPSGWLICDGSAVSRATYDALFAVIGTTYGAGNGSTTFNVPDARGRAAIGAGTGTVTESFANTAVNTTSDFITIPTNTNKWVTGMPVVMTTTGGLPGGITAATTYYVRRLTATTIELYTSLAGAVMDLDEGNGTKIDNRVNFSSQGSGTHTITCTLKERTLGEKLGIDDLSLAVSQMPQHQHEVEQVTVQSGSGEGSVWKSGNSGTNPMPLIGNNVAQNNMPPSLVLNKIIKT